MVIGIPPLLNKIANVGNIATLLIADVKLFLGVNTFKWGIYLNGSPVVLADSVTAFDFKNDSRISDYPLEKGGFESYNKVATPFNSRVRLSKGGSQADRQIFLNAIEKAAASLDLYSVVTPEKTYLNANITGYDYSRTSTNGAGMISVDISLEEVRLKATAAFSSTKTPSGATSVNGGTLTATPAPAQFANGGT